MLDQQGNGQEALFVLAVAFRFYLFKGRTYPVFHFIEESRAESIAEIVVTQWRCWTLTSLKDILVVRSMAYLLPQVGQKRL